MGECELNKFDSMMASLSSTTQLSQVIAADLDFEVFKRAWCVAEIVEADSLKMQQELVLHDMDSLHKHGSSLTQLSVHSCRATRVEDKEGIIQKIGDTAAFDRHLQWRWWRGLSGPRQSAGA